MRRYLYIIVLCLAIGPTAEAQGSAGKKVMVSGGVKADAVFLNFLKKAAPGAVSTLTPGGSLGGFIQIDFNKTIGLRPEFNLNYKQADFGWEDNTGRMRSMGIEIPVFVTAGWDIFRNHRTFIGLGPYTEFGYFARWEIAGRKVDLLKLNKEEEPMIQDSQSGFGAILGYEFGNGLSIDISYRLCCFNILQPNSAQGVSLYPQTLSLGLAYRFRK